MYQSGYANRYERSAGELITCLDYHSLFWFCGKAYLPQQTQSILKRPGEPSLHWRPGYGWELSACSSSGTSFK